MNLAELLKAAGEQTRLRILSVLFDGSLCVCDLQNELDLPEPTVSRHLAVLRHAGLVCAQRRGPRVLYALAAPDEEPLRDFFQFLRRVQWVSRRQGNAAINPENKRKTTRRRADEETASL
jgi:DNA-binding transcriptional ArsR family regulator